MVLNALLASISLLLTTRNIDQNWFEKLGKIKNQKIPKVKVLAILPKDSAFITFVKDPFGTVFVVKQYKQFKACKYFYLVMELLSSHIAQLMDFPVNKVRVINSKIKFPGKKYNNVPATLHLKVPGLRISRLKNEYHDVILRQQCGSKVPREKWGRTREVIHHMARHIDLTVIAAFDTFMCDKGRHSSNLFYDKATDAFWSIDLEKCFKFNLSEIAYENIKRKPKFTKNELVGLKRYKIILQKLIDAFPPERLHGLFDAFIKEAVLPNKIMTDERMQSKITQFKRMMSQSYESAKKLVKLLEKLDNSKC